MSLTLSRGMAIYLVFGLSIRTIEKLKDKEEKDSSQTLANRHLEYSTKFIPNKVG